MTRCLLRGGAIVVAVVLLTASAAMAAFNSNQSAAATYGTATLAAPTNLAVATGPCTVAVHPSVNLTWTATPSTWATGYEVLRSLLSGGPYLSVALVSGVNTTTYNDSTVLFSTVYRYVVRATKSSWRSALSNEAGITTLSPLCT
ncbi:MAG: cellulose 1,4-beta-cellobiosidase [Acidimicrobiaceae bacterium]|jgi:hypothetical protein